MYIVSSYPIAVILSIITMFAWGSWANTQKLASASWPFQLFYRDYVIGVLIFSLIFAFTIGSHGSNGQDFLTNLFQAGLDVLILAFIGGVVFNLANILLVAAIDLVGMAVAFPIAIGISCSLGTVINYISNPSGAKQYLLFSGIAFFLIAVILNSMAFKKIQSTKKIKSAKGIYIAIISGVLMGLFYYAVASSISASFNVIEAQKLTPYTAIVIFSLGVVLSDFIWNSNLMVNLKLWNRVNYREYFNGKLNLHLIGIGGGIIWSLGMCLSIISGGKAGYAISFGLGNGATMVAALWGVFVWKEFKNSTKSTYLLAGAMFIFFSLAIVMIIFSKT